MKINTILLSGGLDESAIELEFNSTKLLNYISYALTKGIVHFQYIKADGSTRLAFGTTKPELIPSKLATKADAMYGLLQEVNNGWDVRLGTANKVMELVEEIEAGHKPAKSHGEHTIIYYDLEQQGFRSFAPENLMAIY